VINKSIHPALSLSLACKHRSTYKQHKVKDVSHAAFTTQTEEVLERKARRTATNTHKMGI
jgi:hypothetical protein